MEQEFKPSHKNLNKLQQMKNGNSKGQLKVIHWNLGSRMWKNKREEIELLLEEYKPDLCFISEANIWQGIESHDLEINDHKLIFPNTMDTIKHARIMLIVKQEIEVEKLNKFMDGNTATIWVRVGKSKKKSLVIGGIYREHNQMGTGGRAASRDVQQREQETRWRSIINNWEKGRK